MRTVTSCIQLQTQRTGACAACGTTRRLPTGQRAARSAAVAMLAGMVCGCGGSALIRRDDEAYRRSLERLQRTRQLVAASQAPDDDQAMFLQAEGLFRYRFASPGRGFGSYVALTM